MRRTGLLVWLACFLLPCVPAELEAAEKLVPADLKQFQVTDQLGFKWDPDVTGILRDGTKDCWDGGMGLSVNGSQFAPPPGMQPLMREDGKELLLAGQAGSLAVTRRLRIDVATGGVRYVDVLENRGKASVSASVELASNLGGTAQHIVTNAGRPIADGAFLDGEHGLVAVQAPGSRPSVLFSVTGESVKVSPTINVQGNKRRINIRYQLNVAPGKSVAILTTVGQRTLVGVPAGDSMEGLFEPFVDPRWGYDLPAPVRRLLVNFRAAADGGPLVPASVVLEEANQLATFHGVERLADDLLILDEDDRLAGSVAADRVRVRTRHGDADLAASEVAVLRGGGGVGRTMRVYLRNGEILVGEVDVPGMRFSTTSGLALRLEARSIETLFFAASEADGQAPKDVEGFLTLLDGTKLALTALDTALTATSPWGTATIPWRDIQRILYTREGIPGLWLYLADTSRFPVALGDEPLRLETSRFGRLDLSMNDVAGWSTARPRPTSDDEADDAPRAIRSHCMLIGECRLAGTIEGETLHLVTGAGRVPVALDRIQAIARAEGDDEASLAFVVTLWDEAETESDDEHGMLKGMLAEPVVAFRTTYAVLHVPTRHVVAVQVAPTPKPAQDGDDEKEGDDAKEGDGDGDGDTGDGKAPAEPVAPGKDGG